MPDFPSIIDLSDINQYGFVVIGDAAGDRAGVSVSSAGDVNGDGFDDFIVGAPYGDNGGLDAGEAYVIFGKSGGFTAIDFTSLTPAQGFIIQGDAAGDNAGKSVASAGDVNGDGFDDIIVGAPTGDNGGTNAGEAYVIFGKSAGFTNIDLTSLTLAQGFIIQGDADTDLLGRAVSSAGDINADGFDDIIVAAPLGDNGGTNAGEAYVIFGKASGFANIDLGTLAAADGFVIQGDDPGDQMGLRVSAAGDINGDGRADLMVSAILNTDGGLASGKVYVLFGKADGFTNIDLTALSSADGFTIQSHTPSGAGTGLSTAGDVNGDGLDDIMIGSPNDADNGNDSGEAYVIFGRTTGFTDIDLATLTPADGFRIRGESAYDKAGAHVSAAGDVNGDGFDDFLVVSPRIDDGGTDIGKVYVFFGKAGGFADIDLADFGPEDGFVVQGAEIFSLVGVSATAAGDIDGDGFDDLIIGGSYGDLGGGDSGTSFIIFGRGFIARDDEVDVEDDGGSGNVFEDNGSGADSASGFTLEVDAVNGSASNVGVQLALASGTLTLNADGNFNYVSNGQFGYLISAAKGAATGAVNTFETDSFTYSLPNGRTAAVTVIINGIDSSDDELWGDGTNNLITGTADPDIIRLQQGGNDSAIGQGGNDNFFLGGAFTALDSLDGAGGFDTVYLDGNYSSSPVVFGAATLLNMEWIELAAGHSYALTSQDATVGAGAQLTVDGSDLAAGQVLTFNGSAETNGQLHLNGGAGSDVLTGGALGDQLVGGAGADQLTGRNGDDAYFVDNVGDQVIETSALGGNDTVNASISYTLGVNIENLSLGGTADVDGTGNGLNNAITGNNGNNKLVGGAGTNVLTGGAGIDTADYSNATAAVAANLLAGIASNNGYGATDTLSGIENLNGSAFNDILSGNSAANVLDGGGGADTMRGGLGNDIYFVDNAADLVEENAASGNDEVRVSAASHVLATNVENLTGVGTVNQSLTGNTLANLIDGGAGGDTMRGLGGNDTYFVDNSLDVVIEAAGGGTDIVNSAISHGLSAEVENLTLTGAAAINGTGNALVNILTGNGAANRLDGGLGADTLKGGLGDDVYVVDQAGDVVSELAGQGTDRVESAIGYTLAAALENLTLTGSANINGTGNIYANILTGNAGANTLNGGAGADVMNGGLGNDTYIVDNSADQVFETSASGGFDIVQTSASFTLGSNIEQLILTGASAINGTGNALANTLTGNSAANVLDGGAGADTMEGFAGNDTYVIDNVGDVAVEVAGGGTDTIRTAFNFTLAAEFENLTLVGTGNVNGTGNNAVNVLTGNSGANQLDGGVGADTMQGGGGNDSYVVDNGLDKVIEAAGGGTDTVNASITHQIAAEVENLNLTGAAAINGFGNSGANTLTGNGAGNRLDGGLGADTLKGGLGDDIYVVDQAGDIVSELAGQGNDTVQSAASYTLADAVENLSLTGTANIDGTGNQFVNVMLGNSGANRLNGGGGADSMNGGLGNDTYVVDNVGDVVIESSATGGTDTVESAISFVLGPTLENLTLTGASAINGTGNGLANTIVGNGAANILNGAAGNDALQGGAGDDTLIGGAGVDTLDGGTGADRFTFLDAPVAADADHILSFAVGADRIVLDDAAFTALPVGALAAGAFVVGTAATDADDRILYDAATGNLFYDSDGNGATAAILFATLDNQPATLAASDFFVT